MLDERLVACANGAVNSTFVGGVEWVKLRTVFLAGVAALLPVAMSAAMADAATSGTASIFTPPSTPLLLTRTLYRTLADGKQLVVTRRYAIRFSSDQGGYRVDGELLGAEVEAPPMLSGLAELERKRTDHGLFPARLDAQGMIREGGAGTLDPQVRQQALARANAVIGDTAIPVEAKRERSGVLGQVATAQSPSAWPVFLFNPGERERVETRRVPLADGSEGQVEVRIRAQGLMPGGIAHMVERTITTRLAGTVRTSREVWTIDAANP
jgi:hypothetical protein